MMTKFMDKVRKPELQTEENLRVRRPATDIYETDDAFVFLMDMPSADGSKLELDCGNEELSIFAPLSGEEKVAYRRRFVLPGNLNSRDASAKFNEGVLEIKLQKVVPTVQRVEVQVH